MEAQYGVDVPVRWSELLSIVGERWTLLVLQELLHGNHPFENRSERVFGAAIVWLRARCPLSKLRPGRNAGQNRTPATTFTCYSALPLNALKRRTKMQQRSQEPSIEAAKRGTLLGQAKRISRNVAWGCVTANFE
ncbi:hypothetical protein QA641_32945 [Bradyrhizobium sp. CB1650]|uniref:hypothetical protein n=1 Tax=Bradyrhizobium sp. CB1650 TaxID=3039153 RepID=UPI00243496B6|nr:hypothetical protein [Bradyrhizobium sp. CB1650]WGD50366.1 hypothetical protein QA641_32945 [Bradyrhizobium sp. CB1650]